MIRTPRAVSSTSFLLAGVLGVCGALAVSGCGRDDGAIASPFADIAAPLPEGFAAILRIDLAVLASSTWFRDGPLGEAKGIAEAGPIVVFVPGRRGAAVPLQELALVLSGTDASATERVLQEAGLVLLDSDDPESVVVSAVLPATARAKHSPPSGFGQVRLRRFVRDGCIAYVPSIDLRDRTFAVAAAIERDGAPVFAVRFSGPRLAKMLRAWQDAESTRPGVIGLGMTVVDQASGDDAFRSQAERFFAALAQFESVLLETGDASRLQRLTILPAPGSELAEWSAALRPIEGDWPVLADAGTLSVAFACDGPRFREALRRGIQGFAPDLDDVWPAAAAWGGRLLVTRTEDEELAVALDATPGSGDELPKFAGRLAGLLGQRIAGPFERHGDWWVATTDAVRMAQRTAATPTFLDARLPPDPTSTFALLPFDGGTIVGRLGADGRLSLEEAPPIR